MKDKIKKTKALGKKSFVTLNGVIVTRLDIVEKVLAAEDVYLASEGTAVDRQKLVDSIVGLIENAGSVSDILDVVAAVDFTKDFVAYLDPAI